MIEINRISITDIQVDTICYGAKDTGELGGGAAAAIAYADGILDAKKVIKSGSKVGDIYVSKANKLNKTSGVKFIIHLVSIIKNTPEGAYCPEPQLIYTGVRNALIKAASLNCKSIAFSAMGTGEGRVTPEDCAKYMIGSAKAFDKEFGADKLKIFFCLPTYRDYNAFIQCLSNL